MKYVVDEDVRTTSGGLVTRYIIRDTEHLEMDNVFCEVSWKYKQKKLGRALQSDFDKRYMFACEDDANVFCAMMNFGYKLTQWKKESNEQDTIAVNCCQNDVGN